MPFSTQDADLKSTTPLEDQRIVEPGRDAWRIVSVYIVASLFWVLFSDLVLNGLDVAPPVYQAIQYVKGGLFILVSGGLFYLILHHKLQRIRFSDETILRENAKLARTVNNLKIIELSLRRQQAEQADLSETLRKEKELLNNIIESAPVFLMVTDDRGAIVQFNPFAEQLTGYRWAELFGRKMDVLLQPDRFCAPVLAPGLFPNQRPDLMDGQETVVMSKNGTLQTMLMSSRTLLNTNGLAKGQLIIGMDITERRQLEQKLHRLAYEDALTGLPNRVRLVEDGNTLIEDSKRHSHQLACIHFDVDNFKQINETLGMPAADALLVDLAGVLRSYEHLGIRMYRLNGDEFGLVMSQVADRSRIAETVDQIFECFSRPWRLDGHSLFITISAGIAVYPDHGEDMTQLMQNAHAALSHAKTKGCNSWMYFDRWMRESSWKNIRLYNDLQQAIHHGQFILHYQPLVDLVTDSIIGLEALIRWPDQAGGFCPPMEFIPFSESTGQIAAISDWVVREVHAQRQIWQNQGVRLVDISINLSGNLLSDGQVIPLFERLARQNGRIWQGIEIEITETAAVSNFEQTITVLGRLKELGFSIALDDFGTGYSSLAYLRKLPIDRIKIDRSFLRDITGDDNQRTIYQSIVTLAHQVGLEVVAEGVETAEQLLMLKTIGCDLAQGYYLSRPLPAADIRLLLEKATGQGSCPFLGPMQLVLQTDPIQPENIRSHLPTYDTILLTPPLRMIPICQQVRSGTMLDRSRPLNHRPVRPGPVLYWMNRDQRATDNWALLTAQQTAVQSGQPLLVVFCLQEAFLGARPEHFSFMLEGLLETARELQDFNIPFIVRQGNPDREVLAVAGQIQAGLIVTDFSPLRLPRQWRSDLATAADEMGLAVWETDAHNIIPCWLASDKLEFAARTIRPKINRQLSAWLTDLPALARHPVDLAGELLQDIAGPGARAVIQQALADLALQSASDGRRQTLPPPGPAAAQRRLSHFIAESLKDFDRRNDPNLPVSSRLSPYLHFGQISAQRVALAVQAAAQGEPDLATPAASFLEELIVRRELSDNFCFYNPDYDNWNGFPAWARQTLERHRADPRAYRYSDEQLENGQTHDPLWNTAQLELRDTGQMPGYLRMYWAKKLLEWCATPEQAQQIAIALNDGLAIDGRDPNGYVGIAWSIGGVHDRPWGERPVFGTIRTMTYDGCRRKFSVDDYIRKGRYRRDG